ncbi:MAG: N-6 DNA methylase [Gammaproteobacteria bacterium]|nr:N-6 DNA methylase [Gammaproteobacteria bacterium]MYF53515.1 N-6 DNA methylase [Gammaproteobacteria bacterium]MYK43973.1 N-6 DNA methylase [Gammaproteobacteria bacterium]
MPQTHLRYEDRVNQGSYYTPPHIVQTALDLVSPYIESNSVVFDSACGYGDFLNCSGELVGCDYDARAVQIAQKRLNLTARFIRSNSLVKVSRSKFGISEGSHLVVVGNPPYNDRTSLIRKGIKNNSSEIDHDLISRDLGISFLRSYDKLQANVVCVLHPLSYLIKQTNFQSLKSFASNYTLIRGLLISSNEFPESAGYTSFPIVIALYVRGTGMDYGTIRSFRFETESGTEFCLDDFDYISNYVEKYPRKCTPSDDSLYFWTIRDINALRRNRTFVDRYSSNSIQIDKTKLEYYAYIDVFKQHLHRLPFYFGNCDVLFDPVLFNKYQDCFLADAAVRHPKLKQYFHTENTLSREAGIDSYFHALLGKHHIN